MTRPLEGIRVVEYAQYVAGPLCGVLLADLGAEVVKVEPPGADAYRQVMPVAPGVGRYFLPLNCGKRSVVLDLKTDRGRSTSRRLLESADVLLHNFPAYRAQRFGLDWAAVHAVDQPDLGDVRVLAPLVRLGGSTPGPASAPALVADTKAVLGGLERR